MKINYKLEVEYQVFEKKGKTYFETKSYVFNYQLNRKGVIDKYVSYQHVLDIASKQTNRLKLSVMEVINKNISGFKIPSLNIYYSAKEFSNSNSGNLLFSPSEDNLQEQLLGIEEERNIYKYYNIKEFETAMVFDLEGNSFKVIKENTVFDYKLIDQQKLRFSLRHEMS